ncbi:Type 4 fimbrial biogenesis protein PilX N-terminal domain-containing protein [Deinococcus saxicola]|uniref:pilus assembly PilX N-terminal domain-containing protein n=1 Tax=Deinococcus saxicola TaxID=249406 RepID=UPI0039F05E7D
MPISPRSPARTTEGATLIVSLLFVMLLLAVIMSVTAQVTLSSRRSSVDQQSLLSARYAAESGVARVQARLKVMKALLDDASIPPTVGNSVVAGQLSALCNGAPIPPPSQTSIQICTFDPSSGLRNGSDTANARVALFLQAVDAQAFQKQGFADVSDATRSSFWSQMFAGTAGIQYTGAASGSSQYQTSFGLIPIRLESQNNAYRLVFRVPSAASQGKSGGTTQNLSARAAAGGDAEYYLLISRPPFAKYGLFTNHHFQTPEAETSLNRISFTDLTTFSGPVHSNQQFRFDGSPTFWGEVTSVGCIAGSLTTTPPECTAKQPGAFFGGSDSAAFLAQSAMSPETAPVRGNNSPAFKSSVKWDADYIELPTNSQDQDAAAQAGGLALSGTVEEMRLWRDTTIVAGQERQRITYTQGGATVNLSYGEDRVLYLLNAANAWVPALRDPVTGLIGLTGGAVPFNGVISVRNNTDPAQTGSILNLNGGPNATLEGEAGASIASFAGITVAAAGDVAVTSSLKYTQPPCSGNNTATVQAPCDNLSVKNILGVYSSGGNVDLVSPQSCPDGPGSCPNIGVNPQLHAVLMASQGAVRVRGYGQAGTGLGKVNLIGGVIENYYGVFGTFNPSDPTTNTTGYGRNFVYDRRTYDGYGPPAFPTQKNWTIELRLKSGTKVESAGLGIRLQGDAVSAGAVTP